MKKLLSIFILLTSIVSYSQTADTIFKMNGETLPVNVTEINESTIRFTYPNEVFSNSIGKNSVLKIKFSSGRTQEFASGLNLINVKSCLDWKNVQISNIESEINGLMKIDNIGAKAKGNTSMSSLGKLQNRTYDKLKIETAMLGGNVCYIINQNTEEAEVGYYTSKSPSVTLSAVCYTSKKVYKHEIKYGEYHLKKIYFLQTNNYNISPLSIKDELFNITDEMIFLENNFPKLKLKSKNIDNISQFTIIFASQNELVLSGVYTSKKGKKTYYNLFLEKND